MTTDSPARIFNDEDCRRCDAALRKLNDVLPLIDKAKACGVDCDDIDAIRGELVTKLTAFKREFFPTQRVTE